jgi:hypothetical protein
MKHKKDPRGTVAVILATAVGLALLGALLLVLGPWTPVPEERIALELFSLIAAIVGGLAVWLGMGGKDHDDDEDGP